MYNQIVYPTRSEPVKPGLLLQWIISVHDNPNPSFFFQINGKLPPVQQGQGKMNSFAIFGADSSDRARWLKGLTKRNSKDGLSSRIDRSPRTITRVLNHSKLFKKLFRAFVSSGEFPTSDGGDLTGERRLFYALGRFTSLHFHMSVSCSKGLTSFPYFDSSNMSKSPIPPHYTTRFSDFDQHPHWCGYLWATTGLAPMYTHCMYGWHIFPVSFDRPIFHHLSP